MTQSTKSRPKKPAKPYPDFPLFPHATRRWAKKIRGKLHYFGPWDDPEAALNSYLEAKDYLHAGKTPPQHPDGLTIRELCNQFLTSKRHLVDTGELATRTWYDYHATCEKIIEAFGRERLIDDLSPVDFEKLRASLAKTRGPVALGNEVQRVRSVFKYAFDQNLVDRPIRYGQTFRKPKKNTLRKHRAQKASKNGKRMFQAGELRKIIAAASQPMKAMILLGVNCGFGNTDVSSLTFRSLDLKDGWVEFPRPKTGIDRRCPLWPETIDALKSAITQRPTPKDEANQDLVFITKYGQAWAKVNAKGTPADAIGQEFTKLLQRPVCPTCEVINTNGAEKCAECGFEPESGDDWNSHHRSGRGFYALRHTTETIGGESRDQVAVDCIMGHADASTAAEYRELLPSDDRLVAVSDQIRAWLFGKGSGAQHNRRKPPM